MVPAAVQAADARGQQGGRAPQRLGGVRAGRWERAATAHAAKAQQAGHRRGGAVRWQREPGIAAEPAAGPVPENDRVRLLQRSQVGSGGRLVAPEQLQHGADHQARGRDRVQQQGRAAVAVRGVRAAGLRGGRLPQVPSAAAVAAREGRGLQHAVRRRLYAARVPEQLARQRGGRRLAEAQATPGAALAAAAAAAASRARGRHRRPAPRPVEAQGGKVRRGRVPVPVSSAAAAVPPATAGQPSRAHHLVLPGRVQSGAAAAVRRHPDVRGRRVLCITPPPCCVWVLAFCK